MKARKYAYVVTRSCKGGSEYVLEIPNLGVHTSKPSAQDHFESVLKDRKRRPGRQIWDRPSPEEVKDRCTVIRVVRFHYKDGSTEEVRLERWPLVPRIVRSIR